MTGIAIGQNPSFQELRMSFFFDNNLAKYSINASFAKSEAWNVNPTNGMEIHLPAPFTLDPKNKVNINKPMAMINEKRANFEK